MKQIFNDQNEAVLCDKCGYCDRFKTFELNGVEVGICNRCGFTQSVDEWRKVKRKTTIFRETKRGLF